jgi:hypothetical protein
MRRTLASLLALGLATSAAEARADDWEEALAGVAILGIVGGTDIGFVVHDAVLFAEGRRPAQPVAIAETAVGAPQALVLHIATAVLAHERGDNEVKLGLIGPSMVVTALTTHGSWALARPDESPNVLFGASTIIGVNAAWTTVSLSNLFDGRMPPSETGLLKMITTAPAAGWAIAEAVESERFTTGWIALSAWSSALFLHGAAELAWGEEGADLVFGRALGIHDVVVAPAPSAEGLTGIAIGGRF